uniref:Uncharacterized protein n=1 Tax=Cannabis sativa TaxID=3483 RepID=A0A803R9W0_CANSA
MEIRRVLEALQIPTHRNLPTQPIIAHIETAQIIQCGQSHRKTPNYLIMIKIQRGQALGKLNLRHIKLQQIPRQVYKLDSFIRSE